MEDNDISHLLEDERFLNYCLGNNEEDVLYWENRLRESPADREKTDQLRNIVRLLAHETGKQEAQAHFQLLKQRIDATPVRTLYPRWRKISIAASVLLLLAAGTWLLSQRKTQIPVAQDTAPVIVPGHSQATLTLASGQQITLTRSLHGTLAQQGATTIQVDSGNSLSYLQQKTAPNDNEPTQYNTLSTARGEQSPYVLVLADGTKVWLNAASSIKYPSAFTGNHRDVEITGEAYFEVVHHADRPFRVIANGQTIEDLGTHFNINAYGDEPAITTTLLEGSVKIHADKKLADVILKPGEQAILAANNGRIAVSNADLEKAVAWKNGTFIFSGEDLGSIMRIISRWYNVDIIYTSQPTNDKYGGIVSRDKNISAVLKMLESTGKVSFRIEGRSITVTPR